MAFWANIAFIYRLMCILRSDVQIIPKIKMMIKNLTVSWVKTLLFCNCIWLTYCGTKEAEWEKRNRALIQEHGLQEEKIIGLPEKFVEPNSDPNEIKHLEDLGTIDLHSGVEASVFWGNGVMASFIDLEANAVIPEEIITSERFIFVLEGSIAQKVGDAQITLTSRKRDEPDGVQSATPRNDFIYLRGGSNAGITAGDKGAKLLELASPLRVDYLEKLNVETPASEPGSGDFDPQSPTVEAGKVYDLYEVQFSKLNSGAFSRLISGERFQVGFSTFFPEEEIPAHLHGQERLIWVNRGGAELSLAGESQSLDAGGLIRIPGNAVQDGKVGELGWDVWEAFWPVKSRYLEKHHADKKIFQEFIPEGEKVELVIDGKKTEPELFFTEGPKWMEGKLYFSNMYFDKDWNGDPKRSSTMVMTPDGTYSPITKGQMQTNGLYPYKNGNLLVCDMMGHRVVEMNTRGRVLRVLADSYDGKPLDGPNDIVTDSKGGFYFTDPQFTMEEEKFQPGRAVYYVSPAGDIQRITEPNEFAMPNGILLSPDGKTLYINNTYDDESWYPVQSDKDNYVWAYDVQEDGSISNGRQFAKLLLTEDVLDREAKSSGADGMAIDKEGNIYVATYYGVQIFDNKGDFVGMINLPSFPVSLCFGDEDMKSLYIVSYSNVFKIRTNKEGFVQRL